MSAIKQRRAPTRGLASVAPDRRHDLLLRALVHVSQCELEHSGFHLDARGSTGHQNWVRFRRPTHDVHGHDGSLVLLMAHGAQEQALLVDAYFVDGTLHIHTPYQKLLQRYGGEADTGRVVRELVDQMGRWPAATAPARC